MENIIPLHTYVHRLNPEVKRRIYYNHGSQSEIMYLFIKNNKINL